MDKSEILDDELAKKQEKKNDKKNISIIKENETISHGFTDLLDPKYKPKDTDSKFEKLLFQIYQLNKYFVMKMIDFFGPKTAARIISFMKLALVLWFIAYFRTCS